MITERDPEHTHGPGGLKPLRYIEITFPKALDPADLEIIKPATRETPGLARLGAAHLSDAPSDLETISRVFSCNGRKFIGYIEAGEPMSPFNETYWLEESNGNH